MAGGKMMGFRTASMSSASESITLLDEQEKATSDLEIEDYTTPSTSQYIQNTLSESWLHPPKSVLAQPTQLCVIFKRAILFLLPSFLPLRMRHHDRHTGELRSFSPTAYLDGMRGLAALFVFFCHLSYTSFTLTLGWGADTSTHQNKSVLLLPIIRLLYSGPPMVCVFFVISGYALSLKPLKQMRSRSFEELFTTLSSSVFRRGLRLFVPTTASTFIVFVLLRLGMYEPTRGIAEDIVLHRNKQEYHPPRLPEGFFFQLAHWIDQMFHFITVFSWEPFAGSTGYDVHLWTIPVEFRASLTLFLVLIALARVKTHARLALLVVIMAFVFRSDRWELMLFFSGTFIAELDLILASANQHVDTTSQTPPTKRPMWKAAFWIWLTLLSLYFMSQPDEDFATAPGWTFLSTLIPTWITEKSRFYQVLGSITFVLSVSRFAPLQKPFEQPVVQYLGRISYALYLMHGPVMHTAGYLVEAFVWRHVTGFDTEARYVAGFVLATLVNVPLVIWASDVWWRFVDAPSVKFARWVEAMVVVERDLGPGGVSRGKAMRV